MKKDELKTNVVQDEDKEQKQPGAWMSGDVIEALDILLRFLWTNARLECVRNNAVVSVSLPLVRDELTRLECWLGKHHLRGRGNLEERIERIVNCEVLGLKIYHT